MTRVTSHPVRRWVIVANDAAAEFYAQERAAEGLRKLFELRNDTARKKTDELISDSAGRTFDSHGQGRHALADRTSKKETAAARFADEVVSRIATARQKDELREYALVSAPRFLGYLRQAMHKRSMDDPFLTVPKDFVNQNISRVERLLAGGQQRRP